MNHPPPLFSVIVPTRNRQQVRDAISSVLTQTVEDFECIIVDDASDQTIGCPFDDIRLKMIRRTKRGGPAAARNTGLAQAAGRYVVFLDDDDLFESNRLALGLRGTASSPLAVCAMRIITQPNLLRPWPRDSVRLQRIPSPGQVTILREAAPTFDERYRVAEDVEWWIRASRIAPPTEIREVGYVVRTRRRPRVRSAGELEVESGDLRRLLEAHDDYFKGNRKAAAWRWKRIGYISRELGDGTGARRAMAMARRIDQSVVGRLDVVATILPVPQLLRPRI